MTDPIRPFLRRTDWADAPLAPLAGDASSRRYYRLTGASGPAILMQDPNPGTVSTFAAIARHLHQSGLSAPRILAEDVKAGLLLLEDLGDDDLARRATAHPTEEPELYAAAVDTLVAFQRITPPAGIPAYSAASMAMMIAPAAEWYARDPGLAGPLAEAALAPLMAVFDTGAMVPCHRDFHAENLLWLPDRTGAARIGLLDFQDAFIGPASYDLASLITDARRDLAPAARTMALTRFAALGNLNPANLARDLAVMGAQRNLRILGIFARLSQLMGKPRYIDLIPRVWAHVQADLAHPDLADLRCLVQDCLPPPDAVHLDRLRHPCPTP